jgi:hypothetical protein
MGDDDDSKSIKESKSRKSESKGRPSMDSRSIKESKKRDKEEKKASRKSIFGRARSKSVAAPSSTP